MENQLSPIVLFTYNRPWHTQQVLDSLVKNEEARDSILYIFCDGPKDNASGEDLVKIDEVRRLVKSESRFKEVIITFQKKNKGLANSIIEGVTQVINKHGKIIVLEDDLILSSFFLSYMNDSLSRYKDNFLVGQIGVCNFFACGKKYPDYFFVPLPDCLGWATWKDRWKSFNSNVDELKEKLEEDDLKRNIFNAYGAYNFIRMLEDQKQGLVDSWAIRWQAVCVLKGWLTLYPNPSMSNHIESKEATHANLNILPPISIKKPNYYTIEVKEVDSVIKAFKLGYSGRGDYFGEEKMKFKKERIKKTIKLFIPPIVFLVYNKLRGK